MIPALLALSLTSAAALAGDELRIGVFVGNNRGAEGMVPLRFAEADARKMQDLFVELGGVERDGATLLVAQPRRNVQAALGMARQRIAAAEAEGRRTMIVFYYSGHGDEHGLELGDTVIAHAELRQWLEDTGADVKIAMLDACRSGAAVRAKGATRGPAMSFRVGVEQARGTAILTSSAAAEFSQESEEIGGGFFTHYLTSALTGAADVNGDGDVSLAEAYAYVHTETAFGTRDTPGAQTPSFDFDLSGAGDVVLTELEAATAAVVFPGGLDGTYVLWDETRKRYVAEVDGGRPARVAVRPGVYYVHHRMPGWVDQAEYVVRAGQIAQVDVGHFESVAYEDTAARGDLRKLSRRAVTPDVSLHLQFGWRGFGRASVYNRQYLPGHNVIGLEARRRWESGMFGAVDVLTGQDTSAELVFDEFTEPVAVSSRSLGASVGWAPRRAFLQPSVAARLEWIGFQRTFHDDSVAPQGVGALSPGLAFGLGAKYRHAMADLRFHTHFLPASWDDQPMPVYGELLLTFGWQF